MPRQIAEPPNDCYFVPLISFEEHLFETELHLPPACSQSARVVYCDIGSDDDPDTPVDGLADGVDGPLRSVPELLDGAEVLGPVVEPPVVPEPELMPEPVLEPAPVLVLESAPEVPLVPELPAAPPAPLEPEPVAPAEPDGPLPLEPPPV